MVIRIENRKYSLEIVPSASNYLEKECDEKRKELYRRFSSPHYFPRYDLWRQMSLETVIKIAKQLRHRSLAHRLSGTVMEVLGTCHSYGCMVDGERPKDVQRKITLGIIVISDE